MAKRRKPRPTGPPPAKSPKMQRISEGAEAPKETRLRAGEPRPPAFRGVLVRAFVISIAYGALLAFVLKEKPVIAAAVALFGFCLMIPLGMLMDRMRYRAQMKRWRRARGIPEPDPKAAKAADPIPAEATSEDA